MITKVETETPVDFVSLWGDKIEGLLLEVEERDDEEVFATALLAPREFAKVIAMDAFAFLEEALDDDMDPIEILDPEVPVKVRLRLRPGMRDHIAGQVLDIGPSVMHALGGYHPLAQMLRQSEAWLLCSATQPEEVPEDVGDPDATLEVGISTAWDR